MNTGEFLANLEGVKKTGDGWQAKCKAHEDGHASLAISEGDKGIVIHCHAGCTPENVVSSMGLKMADLFNDKPERSGPSKRIVATYQYTDETGKTLFDIVRFDPKDFRPRKPDGTWNLKGVQRVLFRLPDVLGAIADGRPIFIPEGEKDVLALEAAGFTGTCNAGGAGKWEPQYTESLSGADVVIIADKDDPGRKHAELVAGHLTGKAKRVRVLELPDINGRTVKDAHDFFTAGGQASELNALAEAAPDWKPKPSALIEEIKKREFNPAATPPPLRTIYSLAGTTICTPGNITTITSAIKTGKSAAAGAMAASAMPKQPDSDLLGFESSNPRAFALVSFDTEQSPDDFWHGNDRIRKRAGLEVLPDWYHAYTLTGLGSKQAWEFWAEVLKIVADQHRGIHSILIDGVADLVADVNDPSESNDKVATIHALAIQYDCPIIGVIHFNPGSDKSPSGGKSRGHLGSQLERKAETNLALEKDSDETTVIYSTKNRRAGIPKSLGPRFAYSVEAGMHVSVASRQSAKDQAERETLMEIASDAFNGRPAMRYCELETTVQDLCKIQKRGAGKKIARMMTLTVLHKSFGGLYTIPGKTGV